MSEFQFVVGLGLRHEGRDHVLALERTRRLWEGVRAAVGDSPEIAVSRSPSGFLCAFRGATFGPVARFLETLANWSRNEDLPLVGTLAGGPTREFELLKGAPNFDGPAAIKAARLLTLLEVGQVAVDESAWDFVWESSDFPESVMLTEGLQVKIHDVLRLSRTPPTESNGERPHLGAPQPGFASTRPSPSAGVQSLPARECDLIMKGGIANGMVYPLAIEELARTYRFKSIGGASAGAIAAAGAAAAELGRSTGRNPQAFRELANLPEDLGSNGLLARLFAPEPDTAPLFDIAFAAVSGKSIGSRIGGAVLAATWAYRDLTVLWLMACLAGVGAFTALPAMPLPAAIVFGSGLAVLLVLALVAGLGLSIYNSVCLSLGPNFYGLCRGSLPALETPNKPPLTNWLYQLFNELAHLPVERPLTFGDLAEQGINLEVITTSLSHGRPYRVPFAESKFFFAPDDFRKLFPEVVVKWMEENTPQQTRVRAKTGSKELRRLPDPSALPVIVGVRMSLSFPVLLSAVPLYAVDYTDPANAAEDLAEPCWFSDGGICSNLPIDFFDGPLPTRPTFGISLRPPAANQPPPMVDKTTIDETAEATAVFLPRHNKSGMNDNWTRFPGEGSGAMSGFLWAVFDAMQSWADNQLCRAPGYRDRIAWVSHSSEEGGLNLDMKPAVISSLARRGKHAGKTLRKHFTERSERSTGAPTGWENHLWIRYRSSLGALQEYIRRMGSALENKAIAEVLNQDDSPSYDFSNLQRKHAHEVAVAVQELARHFDREKPDLKVGGPRSEPVHFAPRLSADYTWDIGGGSSPVGEIEGGHVNRAGPERVH